MRNMDSKATEEEVRTAIEGALGKPDNGRRVVRCHKCLGFGHRRDQCNGADRLTLCYKCRGPDHRMAECQMEPSCFLCKEDGMSKEDCKHVVGPGGCIVFKRVLDRAKKKKRRA
ncbi:zinc finger protein GIS2-like [Nasonia vitripennis]|uniref:CCHC-type domain-containing protein n=1 Tax=Nasonia vitripennis TaxID=7425 RepID=A0A7M7IV62_NASVI|nr:zinc finger protein GIS2-like [Nasonia vitripennis]